MARLKLDCRRPHRRQQDFLDFLCTPSVDGEIRRCHFVAGRGAGKSLAAVLGVLMVCIDEPGTVGLVTAPTNRQLADGFMALWRERVPMDLWTYHSRQGTREHFVQLVNGSMFFLRSRYVDNPSRGADAHRGMNVSWWLDDEGALGYNPRQMSNISACIRRPGEHVFHVDTTTPRLGLYHEWATTEGHTIIHARSADNPYLPKGWVDGQRKIMSAEQAARELDAEFVALDGRIWSGWKDEMWPNGNIWQGAYDKSKPFYLFFDIGVGNGAYAIVQTFDAQKSGLTVFPGRVWVVVAEYTPRSDGSVSRVCQRIKADYGMPSMVVCGADIKTRSQGDATTPEYFVRQIFGAVPLVDISGFEANKMVQYDRLSYLICSAMGERRFCAASGLVEHDTGSRGVLKMVEQDEWPDDGQRRGKVYLPKDGRLEHMRDALLYGAVGIMSPPELTATNRIPQ